MELTQTNTSHSSVNRFRGDGSQTVVSLLAGVDHASVCAMAAPVPAARVARAVPLPPVKDHKGVTIYYARPGDADGDATGALVGRVFGALGTAVPCANETTMATLQVNTAMMGNYYALLQAMHGWTVANGVDADAASTFIGALMHSVAADGKAAGGGGFDALIAEQTPGGYNEMGIRELREAGVYDEVRGREETNRARVACVSRRFVSASDHKRGGPSSQSSNSKPPLKGITTTPASSTTTRLRSRWTRSPRAGRAARTTSGRAVRTSSPTTPARTPSPPPSEHASTRTRSNDAPVGIVRSGHPFFRPGRRQTPGGGSSFHCPRHSFW